jgi:hypothetical protein
MVDEKAYSYRPRCSAPSCDEAAVYKVGAAWSDGTSRELKNYGLACETHRKAQLERARKHHAGLRLADGETVGPVSLFTLEAGRRDTELNEIPDLPA